MDDFRRAVQEAEVASAPLTEAVWSHAARPTMARGKTGRRGSEHSLVPAGTRGRRRVATSRSPARGLNFACTHLEVGHRYFHGAETEKCTEDIGRAARSNCRLRRCQLQTLLKESPDVICGDLNMEPWTPEFKTLTDACTVPDLENQCDDTVRQQGGLHSVSQGWEGACRCLLRAGQPIQRPPACRACSEMMVTGPCRAT